MREKSKKLFGNFSGETKEKEKRRRNLKFLLEILGKQKILIEIDKILGNEERELGYTPYQKKWRELRRRVNEIDLDLDC